MRQESSAIALRPYLPRDAAALASIFIASIETLAADDYDVEQIAAWSAAGEDEAAFGARLAGQLTLVATVDAEPVGFASMKGADHIDMLYVHPGAARQGVATVLCDALEKLAGARGAAHLTVDASDVAEPFFAGRGYVPQQRNTLDLDGVWLANTTMKKPLASNDATKSSSARG